MLAIHGHRGLCTALEVEGGRHFMVVLFNSRVELSTLLASDGKGVVAQGRLDEDGGFVACEVHAKHDENHMPPEAAEALQRGCDFKGRVAVAAGIEVAK